MENTVPLKRSNELAPLSREHHQGLLFVWKINQGIAIGTPVETMSNFTRWFWANHIKPHFKDEEKVLAKFLPADQPLVLQMIKEHTQIRDMVISLDREPDKTTLIILAEFLNNHIRFEERKLFPYVEKTLTAEQLSYVYEHLSSEPYCDTEWKEEFWVRKKES